MAVASSSFAVAMSDLPSPSQPSSSRASSPALTIAQPDHFYGSEGVQLPPSPRSEGKTWLDPDDDPLATRGIPVFKPSMEEFQDFEGYMKKIECWGRRSGIVKVIPPKAWKDALPSVTDKLANIKLHHPIEQHMIGRAGLFRQKNVETFRILSVREWAELCTKDTYRAPSVDDMGLGHHASTTGPYTRSGRARKKTKDPTPAAEQPGPSISLASPESTPVLPIHRLDPEAPAEVKQEGEDLVMDRVTSTLESSQAKGKRKIGRTSKGARLAERAAKDASFMEDFDPDSDWLPPNTTPFDYTPDFCRQLERRFWRMCGMGTPAQYGADMAGSLFHDEKLPWNVAFLPSTLERIMPRAKHPTPGVNLPYLYFGMWRSTFAWHVEDCDLFSINYIHFGAGKFWYAIPQERANAFESVMRGYFPEGPNTCSQFLRHKAFLASPTILAQANCRPNTLVHNAGEFVITYPRGYHAGFNLGLNCAESTNFALESWLDLGRKAKYCTCVGDSVRIDVDALLQEREDEYTADNMTAPQATMLGDHDILNQAVLPQPDPIAGYVDERTLYPLAPAPTPTAHNKPILPRKRKTSGFSDKPPRPSGPKSKKARTAALSSSSSSLVPTKLVLKLGPRPVEQAGFPCTLCVSTSREGLLPVHTRPRYAHAAFASIVQGQWMAHELCARAVPETWIDEIGDVRPDGTRTRAVFGVDSIIRDRLNLRCAACTTMRAKMHGAPVQCTKGKCPKAFHVSCARENADILFREFEMESEVVADEPLVDGSPPDVVKIITKMDFDLLCAQHNPAILEARKASKEDKIRHDLHALPLGSRIKIRGHSGMFEVTLLRVHDEERTVDVIWDLGVERTFKWNSIISDENDIPAADIPSSSLANGSLVRWPAPASASSLAAAELAPSLSSSAAI